MTFLRRMHTVFCFGGCLIFLLHGMAAAQDGPPYPYPSTPGASSNVSLAGRWAAGPCETVFADGSTVYFGNGAYLEIYDMSTPSSPVQLSRVLLPSLVEGIVVDGDYAYIANANAGLRIVDVSSPSSASIVGYVETDEYVYSLAVDGNHVFLAEDEGIRVIDVSDPSKPEELDYAETSIYDIVDIVIRGAYAYAVQDKGYESNLLVYDVSDVTDIQEISSLNVNGIYPRALDISGSTVYVSHNSGISIVDVSDPSNPDLISRFSIWHEWYSHTQGLNVTGDRLYVAKVDEGVYIFDITDPTNLQKVAEYAMEHCVDVAVYGSIVYVAHRHEGISIIDFSNTSSVQEVGSVQTQGDTYATAVHNGYAYLGGDYSGIHVLDVSDPSAPDKAGFLDTGYYDSMYRDIVIEGSYAYASVYWKGFRIFDISSPASPELVGNLDDDREFDCWSAEVQDGYAFLAASNDGLVVVDLSDLSNPSYVTSVDMQSTTYGLDLQGDYAYVACLSGMRIVDISDPTSPSEVGFFDTGYIYDVVVQGDYAYIPYDGLTVVDISDPTNPQEVGSAGTGVSGQNIASQGSLVYTTPDLHVFDVSSPSNPVEVGYYITGDRAEDIFLTDSHIFVSDRGDGLYIFESKSDFQAPSIVLSTSSSTATRSQSFAVSASITDDTGIASATVYYRQGGASSFTSTAMSSSSGNTFSGTIPSSAVSERGLEYYISVSDSAGNTSTSPSSSASTSHHLVQVSYTGLSCPNTTPANSYRMVSVPGDLNSSGTSSVLTDDLGSHDRTEWRLLRGQSGTYVEYGIGSIADFEPGNGFWLITRTAKSWDTGSGKSVSTGSSYSVTLDTGWNQISNPFAFTVNWSDITKSGNVETPVAYTGTGNNTSGYQYNQTQMAPWTGYCVNNLETGSVTIQIPPQAASTTLSKPSSPSDRVGSDGEWVIRIRAECGNASDMDNYIGCLSDAEMDWDRNDFSEAPPIGQFVSVCFPHREWERYPGVYTADFRPAGLGQIWDVEVRSNIERSRVVLRFEGLEDVPDSYRVVLVDASGKMIQDLSRNPVYTFISGEAETRKSLQIVAGEEAFIGVNTADLPLVPTEIQLLPNFPNPFNAETTIQYTLPAETEVDIRVFDLLGRELLVLEDQKKEAGYHRVVWDGHDARGNAVSSGVYLLLFRAGQITQHRKVILTK